MGEVYRARDSRLDRDVAIKVLPHDRVADEHRRQRFVQEAKAASALNHPHIVTIHEIESADGIDFLVMEYVRGKSLDALIPRQGMRLGEALRIAIAVADAVACAHKSNIVHRDLKPANVMVGIDGAVKVLDFGLAKLLTDDEPDPHSLTRTVEEGITKRGAVMGTLAYMSPEQASGDAVDVRSDIFSFGALLYEMTTGQRAFAGKTPAETLSAVMQSQPTLPSTLIPSLPHDLERTILRCLRKEPAKRFQTMADVRVDLAEIKEESDSSRTTAGHDHTARTATGIGSHGSPAPGGGCCGRMVVEHPRLVEVGVSAGCAHRAPPDAADDGARPSDRRDVFTRRPVDRLRLGPGWQLRYLGPAGSGQWRSRAGDEITGGGYGTRLVPRRHSVGVSFRARWRRTLPRIGPRRTGTSGGTVWSPSKMVARWLPHPVLDGTSGLQRRPAVCGWYGWFSSATGPPSSSPTRLKYQRGPGILSATASRSWPRPFNN